MNRRLNLSELDKIHKNSQYYFISVDELEQFEERAAIFEYEAGYSRNEAEEMAYEVIQKQREPYLMAV